MVLAAALPAAAPDAAVVCPEAFRAALGPWLEYRTGQGHEVAVLSSEDSALEIRRRIRRAAEGGRLRFVVLVGDADPAMFDDPSVRARCVPVCWARSEINASLGGEWHIGTDNWYADLDDDGVPELAVGRLTADTPGELARMLEKTVAYERCADFGPWRRKLNFVAGVGGFGPLTDLVLETAARRFLTENIPPAYALSMTYANWASPYCPDPRRFHAAAIQRLNEGCQFWIYLGHGYHLGLDQVRAPDGNYPILESTDAAALDCRRGAPVALLLSCYAGAFDAYEDCLAEELLRARGGPVAVLAASRMAMPYGMAVLGTELAAECFQSRRETLGEAILEAKRRLLGGEVAVNKDRTMLDTLARVVSPTGAKLGKERAEHVLLFNLLGDPLLRLKHGQTIVLSLPGKAKAGQTLEVSGESPFAGRAIVELAVPRDRLASSLPCRSDYAGDCARGGFDERYRQANEDRLASAELSVASGTFRARLAVPEGTQGSCCVRVFIEGKEDFALGAGSIKIDPLPATVAAGGGG
jgi:hypothetical protein